MLRCPIRKTSNSYARVYDAYIPVDEIDETTRKPLKKIASIRVIIYLEDLGPVSQEENIEFNEDLEKDLLKENNPKDFPVLIPETPNNEIFEDDIEKVIKIFYLYEILLKLKKKQIVEEMNSLEYKIVWELENWKKTEVLYYSCIYSYIYRCIYSCIYN